MTTRITGAVFNAIRSEYRSAVKETEWEEARQRDLQALLASSSEKLDAAKRVRVELDSFATQMGWSVEDLML